MPIADVIEHEEFTTYQEKPWQLSRYAVRHIAINTIWKTFMTEEAANAEAYRINRAPIETRWGSKNR